MASEQKQIIAIIGATGKTGKWALRCAIQRGFCIKVLARSPSKILTTLQEVFPEKDDVKPLMESITVVEGSVTDCEKVSELLKGSDIVMSFLGMVKPGEWIVKPGVEAVMGAMQKMEAPPKFLTMSSIGMNDTRAQGTKAWGCCAVLLIRDFLAKACFKDMAAAEEWIIANRGSLNVTICRATVLGDKKGYFKDYSAEKKNWKALTADDVKGLTFSIDRQHVVEAFFDMCRSGEWDNKEVSIFNVV